MPTPCCCGAGRNRKKGEMNGKSGNMNNVLAQIYPTGCFIPGDEVIAVFDADQVPCHISDTCASGQARQWPRPAAVHGLCATPACFLLALLRKAQLVWHASDRRPWKAL